MRPRAIASRAFPTSSGYSRAPNDVVGGGGAIHAKRREQEEARKLKEKSIIALTMQRAVENGLVEKTAGESGQAGSSFRYRRRPRTD